MYGDICSTNEMPDLVKDLCRIIDYMETDRVSIAFHPMCNSKENMWAIRGPTNELVVMLHYGDEFELINGQNGIECTLSIKLEPTEESTIPHSALPALDFDVIKWLKDLVTNGQDETSISVKDSSSCTPSMKQERDESGSRISYETKFYGHLSSVRHNTTDLYEDEPRDSIPKLVEDLRTVIEHVNMGTASITMYSLFESDGNLWAIRPPKKNIVIMLYYAIDYKIIDEYTIGHASSIKQEPNVNFYMNPEPEESIQDFKMTKLHQFGVTNGTHKTSVFEDGYNDHAVFIKQEPQEFSSDLKIKQEPTENYVSNSQIMHTSSVMFQSTDGLSKSTTCNPTLGEDHGFVPQTYSGVVENYTNDSEIFQNYKADLQCDNTVDESLFHYDLKCHSNLRNQEMVHYNGESTQTQSSMILEDTKTYINLTCKIPTVEEDSEEFIALQRLYKLNSSETNGSPRYQHLKTTVIYPCSVQLKPLNISRLKNIHVNTVQEQKACSISNQVNLDKENNFRAECFLCGNGLMVNEKANTRDKTGKMVYHCQDCDKVSPMSDLNSDVKIHAESQFYNCIECEMSFAELASLNMHTRNQHFQHSKLDIKFKKTNLKNRKQVKDDGKEFWCLECDKQFSCQQSLHVHKVVHTGEKPHECLECGKKFSQKSSLNHHMLLHRGEKPHECLHCGKKFSKKNTLNRHTVIHTGEKLYECQQCNKKFSRKGHLEEHKHVHSGEKRFQCLLCVKKFYRKSSLKLHQLVHTGEKPHKCSVCDQKFSRTGSLKEHMLIHSGKKPYECSECDSTFHDRSALRQHINRCHKGHVSEHSGRKN